MTTTYLPEVRIETIRPHGNNPRKDVGDIAELAASIKAIGLLEPLVLAPMNGSEHRLIAGHRRLAAAKKAGLATVPALLREDLDTPPKQLEAMLVENTQRVDLTPVEEAQAYAQLVAFPGYTPTKAAKATGRSVKTVKARLAIAALPQATLDKMLDGQITLADAQTLAEFAGTPHFKSLSKSIGDYNFKYEVQRIRDAEKDAHRLEQIREHFTNTQGWSEAKDQPADTKQVLAKWELRSGPITKALAALGDGPHILVVEGKFWTIYRPLTAEEKTAQEATGSSPERRSEWQRKDEERRAQLDALDPARTVRGEYFKSRLDKLVLKLAERLDLHRLLLRNLLDLTDWEDDDLALSGIATVPGDDDVRNYDPGWVAGASENQLWKALVVIGLRLGANGDGWSAHSHVTPIRAAIALGYEPTDVERALLTDQEFDS